MFYRPFWTGTAIPCTNAFLIIVFLFRNRFLASFGKPISEEENPLSDVLIAHRVSRGGGMSRLFAPGQPSCVQMPQDSIACSIGWDWPRTCTFIVFLRRLRLAVFHYTFLRNVQFSCYHHLMKFGGTILAQVELRQLNFPTHPGPRWSGGVERGEMGTAIPGPMPRWVSGRYRPADPARDVHHSFCKKACTVFLFVYLYEIL